MKFEIKSGLAGQQIIYARQDYEIGKVIWPAWTSDRPNINDHIANGEPLCSVFAEGDHLATVQNLLQARAQHVEALI